ncbi:LamG-like jellyroll fold domain-containing protein [Marinoscillum sp.]|uniref:LamG-like jellyroll fold domain-containing protein n=1 Tax=Marinoscillum sp. TaxID=2024838 RepID=UPI003BAB6B23
MKYCTFLLMSFFLPLAVIHAQQIGIPRIDAMPDFPQPYQMRDWKQVAVRYDSLVFAQASGQYMPFLSVGSAGVNYPELRPIFMDSYVGSSSHGAQREAINVIPAIVGASLVGADKTTHFGVDWVSKVRDFYNLKNGELVYLNGPSDRSGHDWWYETMPNVFFYQLYDLYPDTPGFGDHFLAVANRWLEAVEAMGAGTTPWEVPFMNYRAWNLKEMKPLNEGVKEPEAAGAIAWILYHAYQRTGDQRYLHGAEAALDFLDGLTVNPSYELQLPYGVITAARMNAELGAQYDLEKMISWCFDRGDLRGWGSIVGSWGGMDVSGLIGEANDQGNDYAFIMNGFQQAAALAPLVKYDKRYTRAIAKWILNMANASRLFYSAYLPENQQSDFDWCATNDPQAVIAYEAIKEVWQGTALYARGDSKDAGWASTNLGLYGSSHVGYLGALLAPTNVEGILTIDVNVTDFFVDSPFPTYMVYNPYAESKLVEIQLGDQSKDVYDAISETFILNNVTGTSEVIIGPGEVLLISYIPSGSVVGAEEGRLISNDHVLDYHYGYDFAENLRIRALSATSNPAETGVADTIYCTAQGGEALQYEWYVDDLLQMSDSAAFIWTPEDIGLARIRVVVHAGDKAVEDSLQLDVVAVIPAYPVIDTLFADRRWYQPNDDFWVETEVHDPKGLDFDLDWSVDNATILEQNESKIKVQAPSHGGIISINLTASNYDKQTRQTLQILVTEDAERIAPLVHLPLNESPRDVSDNRFSTTLQGGSYMRGQTEAAEEVLVLSGQADELLIANDPALNFSKAITISFWAYFTDFGQERFVISHGGWEQRWKVSTTTDKRLRWTVNTAAGIKDLDASMILEPSTWYHFTVVYNDGAMQIFANGQLDTFVSHSGEINSAEVDIVIGKRLPGDAQYYLKGRVDEIRIYEEPVGPTQAAMLPVEWYEEPPLSVRSPRTLIYPNPVEQGGFVNIKSSSLKRVMITDMAGKRIDELKMTKAAEGTFNIDLSTVRSGVYLLYPYGASGECYKLVVK